MTAAKARDLDVMIVGVGRSGTTLLASMLKASDDIAVLPETQILRRIFIKRTASLTKFDDMSAALRTDSNLDQYSVDVESIVNQFSNSESYQLRDVYRAYVGSFMPRSDQITIEKNPTAIDYLPFLRQLFPKIRIIHIKRNLEDVVASRVKAGWSSSRSPIWHLVAYQSQTAAAERDRLKYPDRHMTVSYEELLTDPLSATTTLCEFLGAGDPHALVNYSTYADKQLTKAEPWHSNIGRPIDISRVGKGRLELPPKVLKMIDETESPKTTAQSGLVASLSCGHGLLRQAQTYLAIKADKDNA